MVDLAYTDASQPQQEYNMRFLFFIILLSQQLATDSRCQPVWPYSMEGGEIVILDFLLFTSYLSLEHHK